MINKYQWTKYYNKIHAQHQNKSYKDNYRNDGWEAVLLNADFDLNLDIYSCKLDI